MKTSKRIQSLTAEIRVHGIDRALEILAAKYTADEWIQAAERAAGAAPYGLDEETIRYLESVN